MSAAAWAGDASPGSGVEGWVFAVERCIRERQIEVGLYPRGKVLGGKQVRLFVLPVLAPALFVGGGLRLFGETRKQVGMACRDALLRECFGNIGNELEKRQTGVDVAWLRLLRIGAIMERR